MKKEDYFCILVYLSLILVLFSCKKEDQVPTLSTADVTDIFPFSATCGGTILSDGGSYIERKGVCWSTNQLPTIEDNRTTYDTGTETYTSRITGLDENTTYYVRAYATSNIGTGYGQVNAFITTEVPLTVTDIDGNVYNTITIGKQIWLKENLKTTKYSDGSPIQKILDTYEFGNSLTGAFCYYNNDTNNSNIYGNLYNGFAVNTGKLAPEGWHVPSDIEWFTLILTLDSIASRENTDYVSEIAGGMLKEDGYQHWTCRDNLATNISGFTALPGGSLWSEYLLIGIGTYWWSTSGVRMSVFDNSNTGALIWGVNCSSEVIRGDSYYQNGYSVRCIMGN